MTQTLGIPMQATRKLRKAEYDHETQDVVLIARAIQDRDNCTWGEAIKRAEAIKAQSK